MKKFGYLIISVALSIGCLVGQPAGAVSGASWRAGRIIDDSVFTNKNNMSIDQIQSFLNNQVGTGYYGRTPGQCDTNGEAQSELGGGTRAQYGAANLNPAPFTCLKDYYEVPKTSPGPGIPANNYGGLAIPSGAKSAAQLIWDAAQTYNINPKVLLVKLHTESAGPLTTDDWPFLVQYTYAMGAHCPDSGPGGSANCDENYAGFSMQIAESAALLRYYLDNMTQPWWPYKKPFQNNNILWNIVERGCGGGDVYIENKATAALYTYTPYQPNQAALNNMYGTGDYCSAYGNRNFWRTYNDWFGPTIRDLITTVGDGVYLVEDGTKRAFPNEITFLSYSYKWSDVLSISNAELNQIPDGAVIPYNVHFKDGLLVRSTSGGMYIVDNGTKRPFPNEGTFFSYGYTYSDASLISTTELNLIPNGVALSYNVNLRNGHLVSSPSGGMYVVENGTKRAFPNEITFLSYGYTYSDALVISGAEISLIPDGTAMPYRVLFRDGRLITSPSKGIYRVENGVKRAFPNEITFLSYLYRWSDVLSISGTELNLIPDGANMPYNVHLRNGHLVSSPSGGMYVVDNGTKRPFPNEEIFFSYGYTYSDALVITTIELSLIPDGVAMPPKA